MRLFVAHHLGPLQSAKITAITSSMRHWMPKASWVGEHSFHFTFAFLGEQEQAVVDRVSTSLKRHLAGIHRFNCRLEGGGLFPPSGRPRVGWVGVHPSTQLEEISLHVRGALRECRVSYDDKPFKAHLTIVRIRDPWLQTEAETFTKAIDSAEPVELEVDKVSLFESRLCADGAVHTELAALQLH